MAHNIWRLPCRCWVTHLESVESALAYRWSLPMVASGLVGQRSDSVGRCWRTSISSGRLGKMPGPLPSAIVWMQFEEVPESLKEEL